MSVKKRESSETTQTPVVVIVGPPWPGGGTARVMESQIDFYRSHGYQTIFICIPLHCAFVKEHPGWSEIEIGMRELHADHTLFATINWRRFRTAKYLQWIKRGFRPTALDWVVLTADSADLSEESMQLIREAKVALIHVNHVFTLEFARRLARSLPPSTQRIPMIVETHDIQAHALAEKKEINPWTHRLDGVDHLVHSEIRYLEKTDVLVHLSKDDFKFFEEYLPQKCHILTLPTVVQFSEPVDGEEVASTAALTDLLFVGQSTEPNRAAIQWFFEEVWPLIRDQGYRVKIVGQIGALVQESLPKIYRTFSSCFVGPVADVVSEYRTARCVLAPMVSGTGVSIKTIEALAFGKPFVGTSKAFRGMPMDKITEAGLRAHDNPHDFAEAIVRVLTDEESASIASRRAFMGLFSRQASDACRERALRVALNN